MTHTDALFVTSLNVTHTVKVPKQAYQYIKSRHLYTTAYTPHTCCTVLYFRFIYCTSWQNTTYISHLYYIQVALPTWSAPTEICNLPESSTTVDITWGFWLFATSVFYQLVSTTWILSWSNLVPYMQYQKTTTTSLHGVSIWFSLLRYCI